MNREWTAKWIGPGEGDTFHPVFFKDFYLDDPVKKATLFITGIGVFEAYINGVRVGEEYFTPGRFDPEKGIPYYEYDITDLLYSGEESDSNSIDVFLGDGLVQGLPERYALKAELEIEVFRKRGIRDTMFAEAVRASEQQQAEEMEAELEGLLEDDILTEIEDEYETEKIELLAMTGETRSKAADGPDDLNEMGDLDDLDDFLESVIDKETPKENAETRSGNPLPGRRAAQFFTMETEEETAPVQEEKTEPLKAEEIMKEDMKPEAVPEEDPSEDEDLDISIFDFDDWDELNLKEEPKEEPKEAPAPQETSVSLEESSLMEDVQSSESVFEKSEKPETVTEFPDTMIHVEPYSITDEEIEALFNDISPEDTPELEAEIAEEAEEVAIEMEEATEDVMEAPEEEIEAEALEAPEETLETEAEEIPEETLEAEVEEIPEEALEAEAEEIPEETLEAEAEETPEETLEAETEETPEEEALEAPEEAIEAEAEATPEEALEAGAALETVPVDTEPKVMLAGGLPIVLSSAGDAEEADPKAALDNQLVEDVDNLAKEEETPFVNTGMLVGGLPIGEGSPIPQEELPEEVGEHVTLVGGLPFLVKQPDEVSEETVEAVVDEEYTEAVEGFVNSDETVNTPGRSLVGGLPILTESETETILIATDHTWGYYASDIEQCGFGSGECFNRLLWDGREQGEKNVRILDLDLPLVPRDTLPVIVKDKLKANRVIQNEDGSFILDFGEVFTGFVSFESNLERGKRLEMEFASELKDGVFEADDEGSFVYISDGVPEITAPHFTYFTGRYVKVSGMEGEPDPDAFTACVLYSDLARTGYLETSSEVINQIFEDVLMEQKRSSIFIPEDCTERSVYAFAPAASYNMNTKEFLLPYLKELREDPNAGKTAGTALMVWNLYMMYGDEAILTENYELMKRWTDSVESRDKDRAERHYLYDFSDQFEDLPAIDPETDPVFTASAYFYETSRLVSLAASIIGEEKDAFYYRRLAKSIRHAILDEYYTINGRLALDTQSAYITALHFGLYADKERVTDALCKRLEKDHFEVKGSPAEASFILSVLAENGMPDLAYTLLLDENKTWGAGAAEFLYTDVAGIKPLEPGFSSVKLSPIPDGRLQYCFSTYKLAEGDIISVWNISERGELTFHFEIPQGITAKIALPYYPVCAAGGNEVTVKGGSYDYSYMPSKKLLANETAER